MDQQISLANQFFQNHQFDEAIKIYDNLIEQNDKNYVLFCNRSACMFKLGKFKESLEDARIAIQLNPRSIKAYYREGMALNELKMNLKAILAYSKGLTIDKENNQLLKCLLNTLESTKFWTSIEPSINQLKSIETKLDPFLVISLIAQHILTLNYYLESSILLNCCLKIGTDSLKLESSIFASLAVSYWKLASNCDKFDNTNYDLALNAMRNDLNLMIKSNDLEGQYRALSNLASAYYQLKQYDESLTNYRAQLDVAKILQDKIKIIDTKKQIATVHQQLKEFENSINIFEELLIMAKQEDDLNLILKCYKTLSYLYAQLDDHQMICKSIQYQEQVCKLVKKVLNFQKLKPKAYLDLCDLYERIGNHQKSIEISQKLFDYSLNCNDKNLELLIYERLVNNELKLLNYSAAKEWIEKQLILLVEMNSIKENEEIKLNCLINLANINFKLKNYKLSIDLNEQVLNELNSRSCENLNLKEKKIKCLNNLAECHFILKDYLKSIDYFKESLKLDDSRSNEMRIDAMKKLSICFKKTNQLDDTLKVYFDLLNYANEFNDLNIQYQCKLWSYFNIGLLYSANGAYDQAISIFNEYLSKNEFLTKNEENDNQITKIHNTLALIYFKMNDYYESFKHFSKDNQLMDQFKQRLNELKIEINLNYFNNDKITYTKDDLLSFTKICFQLLSSQKQLDQSNQTVDHLLNLFYELNI